MSKERAKGVSIHVDWKDILIIKAKKLKENWKKKTDKEKRGCISSFKSKFKLNYQEIVNTKLPKWLDMDIINNVVYFSGIPTEDD